jgi:hypothetical protein
VKWSDDLSNMVSNIIRKYIDHMKFTPYKTVSIISLSYYSGIIFFNEYMVVCFVCFCLIL